MDIRRKKIIKSSVRESIEKLLEHAGKAYSAGKKERSLRYIGMVLDLLKKYKVKIPRDLKNSFCKKCKLVWIPGDNVTVSYDRKNNCLRVRCKCGYGRRI